MRIISTFGRTFNLYIKKQHVSIYTFQIKSSLIWKV